MGVFSKEPAFIIGVVAACIVAVFQTLVGQGVLTSETGATIENLVWVIVPILAAIVTRFFVYSPSTVAKLTGRG